MTGRRRLLLTATVVAAGGLLGVRPARAGCVGPEVSVNGQLVDRYASPNPTPVNVSRRSELVVTGRWFRHGCEDTVSYSGCSPVRDPPSDPESPQRDVELRLEQSGRSWSLGTGDASPRDQDYQIAWRTSLPVDCATGPATLEIGTMVSIAVVLTA